MFEVEVRSMTGQWTRHSTHESLKDAIDQADMVHGRLAADAQAHIRKQITAEFERIGLSVDKLGACDGWYCSDLDNEGPTGWVRCYSDHGTICGDGYALLTALQEIEPLDPDNEDDYDRIWDALRDFPDQFPE